MVHREQSRVFTLGHFTQTRGDSSWRDGSKGYQASIFERRQSATVHLGDRNGKQLH